MTDIKILVDSGCDTPAEILNELGVDLVPLTISMGNKSVVDFYELNQTEYYDFMRNGDTIPSTAQPGPGTFLSYFEKYMEHDNILAITMSAGGSGTYNSAVLGKQLFEEAHPDAKCKIHIHDSWSCSLVELMQVRETLRLVSEDKNMEEILDYLDKLKRRTTTFFLVEDTKFLIKGGRVSNIKGSVMGALNIKPIVSIVNGVGDNPAITMGFKSGVSKIASTFLKETTEETEVYVTHCDGESNAMMFINKVRETRPNLKYTLTKMWGTMGTHAGPGGIGVFYERSND